jgi:hypothetical protein
MFSKAEHDLRSTLGEMNSWARQRSNFDQGEAKRQMVEWLGQDRRFDAFDHDRLVERVRLCTSNGAQLDLTDPQLRKWGEPRPLDRRW